MSPQKPHILEKLSKGERRQGPIARVANRWFDRVMGAVKEGGLSGQDEEYAAHRTTRDFVWNTVGATAWGVVFPAVTMIATQLVGAEQAGMVSMAFAVGLLLMFLANFGVRTYQISDIDEAHSFNDYQINRWITCAIMVAVGIAYCNLRGYGAEMFNICMGIFAYKMVDGLADVYEGRLQQVDKLYLAGISQAFRSILALLAFAVALLITRDAAVASIAMAVAAAVSFVIITYPLTLLETPRSRRASASSIFVLFKNTAPLFVGLFLFNLIDSMPKFVMEGALSYDNQLFYNALYFPAQSILITAQLVYKPLLVRMAGVWQDNSKHRQFDMISVGILLFVVALTAGFLVVMAWVGVPLLSFLYGIDFEPMRNLLYVMIVAGGVTAAIDFLYQVITVMRRQRDVTTLYVVTFGFSLLIPLLLVSFTGLPGAVLSYLIVMSILLVLLVWEYFRIRRDLAQGRRVVNEPAGPLHSAADAGAGAGSGAGVGSDAAAGLGAEGAANAGAGSGSGAGRTRRSPRPSEVRAERLRREEVMNRRVTNRRSR
ncbi:lipopolysaccharide biosynthesis protein [Adlercreutzia sp. ZJ473]|uniref:lipopolysaccharide biosynthesis protein n=1 Tax=Adlercreutzia sp. ZJ473 TaxID=2722822 RepID=UPI00155810B1|nr:lipopolysaccharide biosynthesis protein [Adlercreutzia sp. ZJ473]